MKLLHVTNTRNLNSIIGNGLLPTNIELDGHWETFSEFLTQRKCVYLWNAETYRNDKFIRDLIYTKMFIHPRNRLFKQKETEIENNGLDIYDSELYPDMKKLGGTLIGDDERFTVLELDSEDIDYWGWWEHVQEPSDNRFDTASFMDDKYAHNDKKLYISGSSINFNNINIVEEVRVRKYKNNKLGFTFRRN